MPIGSRPSRRRLSIQLEPKPPVSSMKQAFASQSAHLRATIPAPCVPSMLRIFIGGKATSPWRGKITLESSPKRATSTPRMRGAMAMSSCFQARLVASAHSSGPISVSSEPGGNWPNTLTSTHGLSRPYFSICSRAHCAEMRVARFGSSGSPVISVMCHRWRSLVQARYSGPSRWVGLPACTMWPSLHEESAASAAAITASGMPPDSSRMNRMESLCRPASVWPRLAGSADFAQVRALIHQVLSRRLLTMRLWVHLKPPLSSGDFACHFAISAHSPSRRLSPLTLVAAILGSWLTVRKFQASQASTAVLPGPLHAFIASRWLRGKAASTSSCHGSGVTPNCSRTNRRGSAFQARRRAVSLIVMTPFRRCAPPSPADRGRREVLPPPVCGGRWPRSGRRGVFSFRSPFVVLLVVRVAVADDLAGERVVLGQAAAVGDALAIVAGPARNPTAVLVDELLVGRQLALRLFRLGLRLTLSLRLRLFGRPIPFGEPLGLALLRRHHLRRLGRLRRRDERLEAAGLGGAHEILLWRRGVLRRAHERLATGDLALQVRPDLPLGGHGSSPLICRPCASSSCIFSHSVPVAMARRRCSSIRLILSASLARIWFCATSRISVT